MRTAKAASLYFALVFGTGFVLGSIRVPFLVPRLGERYAELLEMPIMFAAILLAARYIVRRFQLPASWAVCLRVGFTALGLLVAAELLLSAVLQGRSLGQYLASRDPVSGSVYLVMLLVFALMPAIVARRGATAVSSAHGKASPHHRADSSRRAAALRGSSRTSGSYGAAGQEARTSVNTGDDHRALVAVKVVHTVVWAFFVLCIAAIPVLTWRGEYVTATWFAGIVFVEVLVIVLNRRRCPLTPVAARYTEDRRANFDIFLPEWLARHNQTIFGVLYFAGVVYLVLSWAAQRP